jgi:murein DD-endopeptidase MepM/ murein hydrolase activator NlpD
MLAVLLAVSLAADVRVQPGTVRPGDAVLVTVHGAKEPPKGSLGGWALRFAPFRGGHQAIIGLPTDLAPGELKLSVDVESESGHELYEIPLDLIDPKFRRDELKVARKFVTPSPAEKKWSAQDAKEFTRAFAQPFVGRLFDQAFTWPKLARLSAPFGDLRLINGQVKSQHYGADIDGDTGDPTYAANDGTVVMSRACFGSGNTVLIHHGAALYTAYFHLSRIDVKKGDKVKQGDPIGLVGKTGRVTGPHLHWGVKIDGRWVDPLSVLALDFE